MKTKKRQKLCHHCEGEVDLDVIVCPFCAADLREEKPELERTSYDPTLSLKNLTTQDSLYVPKPKPKEEANSHDAMNFVGQEEEEQGGEWKSFLLLTVGVQLLILGLMMLIFSKDGFLWLRWDARFWFLYVLTSIPFILFGYRFLLKL